MPAQTVSIPSTSRPRKSTKLSWPVQPSHGPNGKSANGVLLKNAKQERLPMMLLDPPESREKAEADSQDCPYCGASGQVVIYHPEYNGQPGIKQIRHGQEHQIPARVVAHCICPLGRWMRNRIPEDIRRRIPDFDDILAGRSKWTERDPTTPELPDGCHEGMSFTEFWNVIKRPGQGPVHVQRKPSSRYPGPIPNDPVLASERKREPGDDG